MRPKVPNDELRRRRLALGWSQERLANELNRRMAAAGLAGTCTGRRVARWERGQARPGADYAPFLAEALGCTLAQLGLEDGRNAGLARLAASPRPVVLLQLPEVPAGWLPGLPSASGDASADALAVEAFRTADRQVGGGHLYASVVRYLQAELGPRRSRASARGGDRPRR